MDILTYLNYCRAIRRPVQEMERALDKPKGVIAAPSTQAKSASTAPSVSFGSTTKPPESKGFSFEGTPGAVMIRRSVTLPPAASDIEASRNLPSKKRGCDSPSDLAANEGEDDYDSDYNDYGGYFGVMPDYMYAKDTQSYAKSHHSSFTMSPNCDYQQAFFHRRLVGGRRG